MFCPSCGTRNEDTSRFCSGCGEQLQQSPEGVAQASSEAPISKTCSYCGCKLEVDPSLAGQMVQCPDCDAWIKVPVATTIKVPVFTTSSAPPSGPISTTCAYCGSKFEVDSSLAGQMVQCSGCGASIKVPVVTSALAGRRGRCKHCRTPIPVGTNPCPHCGNELKWPTVSPMRSYPVKPTRENAVNKIEPDPPASRSSFDPSLPIIRIVSKGILSKVIREFINI